MEFDLKWVNQVSIDHYTKLTHHVNSFNCSKCIFSRFYCCWIVDEKQLYFPSIWCKQTFCEEERCESRWPRFALSVTEWGGWHLPYMGVCIQFDTSKLTDISKYIFDKPQMAYTKWQSERVVRVDYEGGICHTWEFTSSLIHSNWPIYPNIPTDWTGVCFQKQFWESEFEGLMSADHITSLPCEQVSSTTPNFEIVLIICDHILATTLPPHVKWRCLRSKLLFQEVRSQTPQWVSAQFSNNWKPWLFCFHATEYQRNTGPHCHLKFEGFHELQRIIPILFSGQSSDQLGLAASLNPYLSSSYHCIQCGRVEINILFVLWY